MLPAWVNDYVGVPFLSRGRDTDGWDCWGMVRLVLSRHFGKELPSFGAGYCDANAREEVARLIDQSRPLVNARRVEDPEAGDLVLFVYQGQPCHIGVFVGDNQVLHVMGKAGTVIERLESLRLHRRVEGFYRV